MEGLDPPAHGKRKVEDCYVGLTMYIHGVNILVGTNDGWNYLDDDLITAFYRAPLEWISLMRRIAVVAEYVREETQGEVSMEEERSDEEEDTELEEDDSN